jgi:hypothetical protein
MVLTQGYLHGYRGMGMGIEQPKYELHDDRAFIFVVGWTWKVEIHSCTFFFLSGILKNINIYPSFIYYPHGLLVLNGLWVQHLVSGAANLKANVDTCISVQGIKPYS